MLDTEAQLPKGARWLSKRPPILEMDNFLTTKQCLSLIKEGKPKLSGERMVGGDAQHNLFDIKGLDERLAVGMYDLDKDGSLNNTEFRLLLRWADVYPDKQLLKDIFKAGREDNIKDGGLAKIVSKAVEERPWLNGRYSSQGFLSHEQLDAGAVLRGLSKLLGVEASVLEEHAEPLQVVHYEPKGHYMCHHDSQEHVHVSGHEANDYIRPLTAIVYLNDAGSGLLSGGQTTFPFVGNRELTTYDYLMFAHHGGCYGPGAEEAVRNCSKTGLVVQPKRGRLVLFASASVRRNDPDEPWQIQEILPSYHVSCNVGPRSEKWAAQQWISVKPFNRTSKFFIDTAKDEGEPGTTAYLGKSYFEGTNGVPQNFKLAKKFLKKAAASGDQESKDLLKNFEEIKALSEGEL